MCYVIQHSNKRFQCIYVKSMDQYACFSFGRNTLREWVCMSDPRHVLCLDIFPSPEMFLRESGLSRLRVSDGHSGRNSE